MIHFFLFKTYNTLNNNTSDKESKIDKKMKFTLIIGCIIFISIDLVQTNCRIFKDWTELSMEERLLMSEIIVYGKTKEHRANVKKVAGKPSYEIDAVFEVYCVLEGGEEPTREEIIIERIAPRDCCSGTKEHMKIGEEAIVGLKMTSDGNYEYDEAMPTQSASFAATKTNFYSLSSVCGLQSWSAPINASVNKCPICGIGNFSEKVMSSAVNEQIRPCFLDGIQVVNDTECNMFATSSIDTFSTCIPADFDLTCVRLLFTKPSVTYECSMTPVRKTNFGDLGEIDAALVTLPCVTTMTICLFAGLLSLNVHKTSIY